MEITKLLTNEKALELAEKLLQNDKNIRDKLDTDKADLIYVQDNLKSLDHDISELSSVTNNALESIDRDMIREQDRVNTELDKKVDKVYGKGLSTNDYTTDEKTKLEGLSNYDDSAIKNTIDQNTKNIATKLDKNQGTSNAGKITGINGSGDIVPMFPQGITYNEETQCLEYGVDEKLNLNAGIQLDDTLSKSGYAADASKVGELKSEIADKATIENGVIKFWKTSTEESGTDTLLYSVDISSIGGTGGLDLENLTLSVSQVGEYQRLSMSDGTTIKTVDIPITVITDEQVSNAVNEYLELNPVEVDEWKILVPTDNGMKPINTLTNERSIREKAIQLNADGTKAHNLAMVKLSGDYFFATWIEYTSSDYANGGSQCFEKWAVLKINNTVISIQNWTALDNTFGISIVSSGTLFDGVEITNGVISDASDATIFRISDTKLAVMAEVTCGSTARYACTATIEFDSSYNPTITYNEPTINGEFWDMKVIDPTWNSFYQFNNEPSLVSSTYYLPIVVNYKGVQILSTTDGIAFTTAYFVECEHAYLEVSLTKTSASRFFMAIRSHYSDGALYLVTGTVADGVTTIVDKRRILGVGSARPHIMKCNSQNSGGIVINMPFYVFCCDAERKNGHLYKVRTYDSYGSGKIIEAVDVSTWNNICCYPTHIDFTGTGNISGETPIRNQLFGGTDTSKNNVYVFPIAILDKYQNHAFRDGVDILAPNSNDYVLPVATSETLGGIIAENATAEDTVPVHIKDDGSLVVPTYPEASGSSSGDGWEDIAELTIESSQTSFSVTLSKTYKELELVLADVVASGTGELTVGIDNIGWDNNKLFSIANILSTSWIFGRFHVRNTIPKYFITVDYDVRGWSTNNSATANKAVQSGALVEFKGNLIIGSSTSGLTFESGRIIVRGKA